MKQKHEEILVQLVAKLNSAAAGQLDSVVLYGSGADTEFAEGFSDLNVLVTLKQVDAATMQALAPAIEWWTRQGNPVPVVIGAAELRRAADVFAIEFIDMKRRHRLLHGEDHLPSVEVPRDMHRVQIERELRTALVKLRQGYLVAKGDAAIARLMTSSISSFATLFRHALLLFGEAAPIEKRASIAAIGQHLGMDVTAMLQVLDIREGRAPVKQCSAMFAAYLAAVTRVTDEVDRRLG